MTKTTHSVLPPEAQKILMAAARDDKRRRKGVPPEQHDLYQYRESVDLAIKRVKESWPEFFRW